MKLQQAMAHKNTHLFTLNSKDTLLLLTAWITVTVGEWFIQSSDPKWTLTDNLRISLTAITSTLYHTTYSFSYTFYTLTT